MKPNSERYIKIMSRVDTSGGPDSCHIWTGSAQDDRGYGRMMVNGGVWRVHRWLLGYARGVHLGANETANHRCDNPRCVNLRHLYVGTQDENVRDMVQRNRGRNPRADAFAARAECEYGHAYSPENTYIHPNGDRRCRACKARHDREYQARRKARMAWG